MPLYDYRCPNHGIIEVYLKSYKDADDIKPVCKCGADCELQIPIPAMQPDNMWAGQYVGSLGRSFSSKSEMRRYMKQNNLEPVSDRDTRDIKSRDMTETEKQTKERREVIANTVREMVI